MNRFSYVDERGYIHFRYEMWKEYRRGLFESYPVPAGKVRVEMELWHSHDNIGDLPFAWNPHLEVDSILPAWFPFYSDSDSDWSTIFEVQEFQSSIGRHLRIFVEHGHVQPWGESIRLSSTSSEFEDERSNRTAYFRGQHWVIVGPVFHYTPIGLTPIDEVLGHADMMSLVSRLNQNIHGLRHIDLDSDIDLILDSDIDLTLMGNRTWTEAESRPPKIRLRRPDWSKNGF